MAISDNQRDDNADTRQKNQPDSVISSCDWYKSIRPIVQLGDQYRHENPAISPTPSLNYVSPDENRALILA